MSIFLAAAIRFFANLDKPHPLRGHLENPGTLVDHNLSVLMLPMIISGSSIGILKNIVLPEIVSLSLFTIIMIYLGYGTFKKAYNMYITEDKIYKKIKAAIKEAFMRHFVKTKEKITGEIQEKIKIRIAEAFQKHFLRQKE